MCTDDVRVAGAPTRSLACPGARPLIRWHGWREPTRDVPRPGQMAACRDERRRVFGVPRCRASCLRDASLPPPRVMSLASAHAGPKRRGATGRARRARRKRM